MESKVNYTIVGIFVIVLGIAGIGAAFWLTSGYSRDYETYLVYMDESVSGLSERSAVRYNGVNVGYVASIRLNKRNPQTVILVLKILPSVPVTTSTYASLRSQGITGLAYIGLRAKTPYAPPLKVRPGEKYPVIPSEASFLASIDDTLQAITSDFRSISESIKDLLDQDSVESIKKTIQNIEDFTGVLAQNDEALDGTIKDLDVAVSNIAEASAEVPGLVDDIRTTVNTINRVAGKIGVTSDEATGAVQSVKLAVEMIQQQTLPNLVEFLKRANTIAANIEVLSNELVEDPSILIRGTEQTLGPGEA